MRRTSRSIAGLVFIALSAEASFAAARILNYENRVVSAAEQIERIKKDRDYSEEGMLFIKRLLPVKEEIEFDGRIVTVDNSWLYKLLEKYASEKDPQQSLALLTEVSGRLRALDEHLRRADSESAGSGNPREQVREILRRPAFQPEPETPAGRLVKSVLRRVREVIDQIKGKLRNLLEGILGAGAANGWLSKVILLVLLGAGAFFVVQLAYRFKRGRKPRRKTRIILGEEVNADQTSGDLAEAALRAARAGDFRTAIRKLYVSLLYELGELNLIEIEDSATNHEYLRKVSRFSILVEPMRYLTDRFDYVWYGMFPSSEDDFASYRAYYDEAMRQAKRLDAERVGAV